MNLKQLYDRAKEVHLASRSGAPFVATPHVYAKFSRARMRDLPTHLRSACRALGDRALDAIDARELTEENLERVRVHLEAAGKREDVVRNTVSTLRLMRDLAIAEGVEIAVLPKLVRPARGRVYAKTGTGSYRLLAKAAYVPNNTPYRLKREDWPPHLVVEFEGVRRFYCDEFADHRNDTILRPTTFAMRVTRFERAFEIEVARGVGPADLGFRALATKAVVVEHRRFFHGRNGGRDTEGLRGYMDQLRALAHDFFEDKAAAEEIGLYMAKKCKFKPIKDKNDLVERVHADHLYHVLECLVAEARAYERDLKRKKGRKHPKAMMAAHWHKAAMWGFTLATMLREQNVIGATAKHIYKKPDCSWAFKFADREMKSGRAKADDVVDLWRGQPALMLVRLALDKAQETRPFLVERFLAEHPGAAEPDAFFLTMDGGPFTPGAARTFFSAASVKYLGARGRISFHDVRTIVPSWMFVREGYEVLDVLQVHLDHKNPETTARHYIRIKNVFGARLRAMQMEERARKRQLDASLHALPAQITGILQQHVAQIDAKLAEITDALDPQVMARLQHALAALEQLGVTPPGGSAA